MTIKNFEHNIIVSGKDFKDINIQNELKKIIDCHSHLINHILYKKYKNNQHIKAIEFKQNIKKHNTLLNRQIESLLNQSHKSKNYEKTKSKNLGYTKQRLNVNGKSYITVSKKLKK